jgi:hypothetical protein
MRRAAVLLAVVIAAVLSVDALAKEGGIELSSTPAGTKPGEPWKPTLVLIEGSPKMLAQAEPGIRITNLKSGDTRDFSAAPTAQNGTYTVRVVFPEAGTWSYVAYDGVSGREYEFPAVTITAPQIATPATPGGSGVPAWPLVAASLAMLGAIAAGLVIVRRRRLAAPA